MVRFLNSGGILIKMLSPARKSLIAMVMSISGMTPFHCQGPAVSDHRYDSSFIVGGVYIRFWHGKRIDSPQTNRLEVYSQDMRNLYHHTFLDTDNDLKVDDYTFTVSESGGKARYIDIEGEVPTVETIQSHEIGSNVSPSVQERFKSYLDQIAELQNLPPLHQ